MHKLEEVENANIELQKEKYYSQRQADELRRQLDDETKVMFLWGGGRGRNENYYLVGGGDAKYCFLSWWWEERRTKRDDETKVMLLMWGGRGWGWD